MPLQRISDLIDGAPPIPPLSLIEISLAVGSPATSYASRQFTINDLFTDIQSPGVSGSADGIAFIPPSTTIAGWAVGSNYGNRGEVDFWATVDNELAGFNWYQKTGASTQVLLLDLTGDATFANLDLYVGSDFIFCGLDSTAAGIGTGTNIPLNVWVNNVETASFPTTGGISILSDSGQSADIKSLTELTTIAASASSTTTIQIPARSMVLGVSVRNTVAIPTAATYTVGVTGAAARYGTGIAVAINTTFASPPTDNVFYYAAATSILITPSLTPANNNGRVRVTIHYIAFTPPTS